jgi:hypothetical protein
VSAKIGIRLEDKNEWETRVPLVPNGVEALVAEGVDIRVQRFPRRVFPTALTRPLERHSSTTCEIAIWSLA